MWSPNRNKRPAGQLVDTIILHSTGSDSDAGAYAWMMNPASKVSAHYLIEKDGDIIKLVPTVDRAWHAGSCLKGLGDMNSRSIGIEVTGIGEITQAQRQSLVKLIQDLRQAIPTIRYLAGHGAVNQRKTDPYWSVAPVRALTGLQPLLGQRPEPHG